MQTALQQYTKTAIFNLFLVAFIGVILRYKIAFALAFINQKNLLHGHYHFAFSGWITHTVMLLFINYLAKEGGDNIIKKYKWLLIANLGTAYGMLISFTLQGYTILSISFSTISIFISYFFAITFSKDLNNLQKKCVSHLWMKASLLFSVISSLGAFALAFMMITKTFNQNWYLASVYFFLHFQYNGWFFFACMGLAINKFLPYVTQKMKLIFWLFASACLPAYILSALWLPIPTWSYSIVIFAALSQLIGWLLLLQQIKKNIQFIKNSTSYESLQLIMLAAVALTIKLLLQLGSTIPSLSKLAFGFRPIVIGYLHLILLGVITFFLLGFMLTEKKITTTKTAVIALKTFAVGVIINELLLMIQGVAAMTFIPMPLSNELLLGSAIVMLTGIGLLNISVLKQ